MTPDDPRHGTKQGYNRGCRDQCCRHAQMVSVKRHRLGMSDSLVDSTPSVRRLQALSAIGYTNAEIAAAVGQSNNQWFTNRLRYPMVRTSSAKAIADLYEKWCMTIPPNTVASRRARMRAARKGWAPPLAWDDIDTDAEPYGVREKTRSHAELRAEYEFLSDAGESFESIARSLGVKPSSLDEMLRRGEREAA